MHSYITKSYRTVIYIPVSGSTGLQDNASEAAVRY